MLYKWDIIGHEDQLAALERDIKTGNLSHAYLLSGPERVGKFTVAKKLANILQCPENYCHKCRICKQIEKGVHADTIQMKDDGKSIKIDQIRELIGRLNMTAVSNYKIFLAENIERMPHEAANALLKTLEDPPPNSIFICTTTNIREVLPTIISRMRIIRFNNFSEGFLVKAFLELFPDEDPAVVRQVCALSMGKSGQVFKLLRDGQLLSYFKNLYSDVVRLLETDTIVEKFSYVAEISEDQKTIADFLDMMLHVMRSRMLDGQNRDREKIIRNIEAIQAVSPLLKKNINTKLTLENLMLSV